MLPRDLRAALDRHRRTSLFSNPLRGLRRAQDLESRGVTTWIGERPDGALELVRQARGEAALELLLNEVAALGAVEHRALPTLLWTARTGDEALALGLRWPRTYTPPEPFDLRWLLRAFVTLGRAVGALHQAGWVHADVTPDAILWSEDPDDVGLWDLRIAQRPGPRRFDAYSARYAAPEQVTGDRLDARSDVYALGVCLYSLFIRQRFPAILAPGAATSAGGAALSPITCLGDLLPDGGPARSAGDAQATLGAKVLFASELERVIRRNTDIAVARELLRLIERATAHDPAERFPSGDAFAAALAELLSLAEEQAEP